MDYNSGYVAGVEEVLHLIEIAKYKPWEAVDYAEENDPGEGYSRRWREGREDALTKLYYLFKCISREEEEEHE